ncbi:glycosyltransferase family 2 protein [Citrobacter portucalensis]
MNKVSVIIPCYNSASYIKKAIDSVLIQGDDIMEVLCIDDCSEDNTVDVISDIASNNGIVKLIKKDKNSGPATSRNLGLDMAQGDFIAFLDSDDIWCPGKIDVQLKYLLNGDYDCVFSGFVTNQFYKVDCVESIKEIKLNEILFKNYISTSSVLMRANDLRFIDGLKYSEDYDFWLRMVLQGKKLGLISPALYIRSDANDGLSLSNKIYAMQYGEMSALIRNSSQYKSLIIPSLLFSLVKFTRRVLLNYARKFKGNI